MSIFNYSSYCEIIRVESDKKKVTAKQLQKDFDKLNWELNDIAEKVKEIKKLQIEINKQLKIIGKTYMVSKKGKTKIISIKEYDKVMQMKGRMEKQRLKNVELLKQYDDQIKNLHKKIDEVNKLLSQFTGKILYFKDYNNE